MARRNAPAGAPAYINPAATPGRRISNNPNESAFSKFLRTEIYAPEKISGNINILTAATVFFVGIAAVRTWGDLMIVA